MKPRFHNPERLNKTQSSNLDFNQFAKEYGEAIHALGILKGLETNFPNPKLLIAPLTAKEAAASSLIEGTVSTVSEVFEYEAGGRGGDETRQVANYRLALTSGIEEIQRGRELSTHLIETMHGILMRGVRCRGKPGQFRQEVVFVANRPTDTIEKARYVPPDFVQVRGYMDNLIQFANKGNDSSIIKAGLVHYQFEAIHPFEDGNGRLGRMLVPLILVKEKLLSYPILYLSGYLEEYKDQYIDILHEVDETGNYEPWIRYFLLAVTTQAKETIDLIEKVFGLYDKIKENFKNTKSPYFIPFLDFLFEAPYFTVSQAKKKLGATQVTVYSLIDMLKQPGWIYELKIRKGREKLFAFKSLTDLIN